MLLKAALTSLRRGGTLTAEPVSASHEVSVRHLAAYNAVCGFGLRDALPLTYPHVLGFPLQMKLMTGAGFPFPLPGLVHVANRITQSRALAVGEPLEITVSARDLRPHPQGTQVDVVTSVSGVWEGVSTYLRRSGGTSGPGEELERPAGSAVWRVPADIGRRYGTVSGDRNPIHLHPVGAKLFGFPRAIAHGMWTKARCVAALEGRLPEAVTVAVRFKKPLLIPGRVEFSASGSADGWEFAVWGKGPHLVGSAT
ncbi:MaoC like domain-containing protein [Lentzea xinjiangensis]|uniref:MaoC like domain-containing protein n=1 Tax=Lentzea xinjiangensis TaxID=402600 RepID=A0A1H9AA31_9PSEU|nr:MaoC/PaaZ C-terminal domain-containing protein [Lentzea xinjiangensis]SEP73485.1 MaoC like domain-containing protein [Lentzea xinjiangensis]